MAAGLLFMSATDEELQYVHEGGMDHVTYILIMFRYAPHLSPLSPSLTYYLPRIFRTVASIAFLLYTHIVFLITLYATSGRNALDGASMKNTSGSIELTATPTASRGAWYSRVRTEDPVHVIGNDEEDED